MERNQKIRRGVRVNLRKVLTELRFATKRSAIAECEGKVIGMILNLREGLIHDLQDRFEKDGYCTHIVREIVTRKFDEL